MKYQHFLGFAFAAVLLSSCVTQPTENDQVAINKMLTGVFEPIYTISLLRSGAIDVLYCSGSFRYKNNRWPRDYNELCAFVNQSDGYLVIGPYERVDVKPLPNDDLEIRYVRLGQTNESKLTLSDPDRKK